jgi:hypothetical protein
MNHADLVREILASVRAAAGAAAFRLPAECGRVRDGPEAPQAGSLTSPI